MIRKANGKRQVEICETYCIGCGLCKANGLADFEKNEKGFYSPTFFNENQVVDFLKNVCPVLDKHSNNTKVWGDAIGIYQSYSNDESIRYKASSGGTLTEISIYLLEQGIVDGVIQVKVDEKNPISTKIQISRTKEDVISCCGSRYSISSPWDKLDEILKPNEKYAAIGKPCDIRALRNAKDKLGKYENITILLSFFCAGMPSEKANLRLLSTLGCKYDDCDSLTYRGNGWPGKTIAVDKNCKEFSMNYGNSWGGILGRDVHPLCRLCLDGIGECADIACGDGWFIDEKGQPDFGESHKGRNVTFSRSSKGEVILRQMSEKNRLFLDVWDTQAPLEKIQNYQYLRKMTIKSKLLAYWFFGKDTPNYDRRIISNFSSKVSSAVKIKMFLGTIKRIVKKRI